MGAIELPFGFSAQQRAWYESLVPEIPEQAVREVLRESGHRDQREDLLQEAHLGTARAVETFDASRGGLRMWAYFAALHAARGVLRRERSHARIVARLSAGITLYAQSETRKARVLEGSDEDDRAMLTSLRDRAVAAQVVAVALIDVADGGEEELVERATAARCAAVLEDAIGDLSAPRRELLRACFADDATVKEVAAARSSKGYRAVLAEFHSAVGLVAARMRGKGFRELPPFPPEARERILGEPSDAHLAHERDDERGGVVAPVRARTSAT